MPQALVSSQSNEDVVRGFQMGFSHAASLVQSQRQQEQENQREQMRLDAQMQEREDAIRNQYAIHAMTIAEKAKEFSEKTKQGRTDTINTDKYNAVRNVLENARANTEAYLKTNRDYITNSKEYERKIKTINTNIVALAGLKPGADGIYDDKDLAVFSNVPDDPEPKFTPQYQKQQQLEIADKQSKIDKRNKPGAVKPPKLSDFQKIVNNGVVAHQKYEQAAGPQRAMIAKYGSLDAWASVVKDAQNPSLVGDFNNVQRNMNVAREGWNKGVTPLLNALTDPNQAGNAYDPGLALLISRGKQEHNGLASPEDFDNWRNEMSQLPNVAPEITKLNNFITGNFYVPGQTAPASVSGDSGTDAEEDDK